MRPCILKLPEKGKVYVQDSLSWLTYCCLKVMPDFETLPKEDVDEEIEAIQRSWKPAKKPSWRLWGEERIDGAVYTVYLKKVRYHHQSTSVTDEDDDEISHLEWETVRVRVIKAGTLEKLVESLTTDTGELESSYISVFLATYRSFANAKQVLNLLFERYKLLSETNVQMKEETRELHQKNICLALTVWLDTYPEDFRESPYYDLMHKIIHFSKTKMENFELVSRAQSLLERFKTENVPEHEEDITSPLIKFQISLCDNYNTKSYDYMEVPNLFFAEQLTLMDVELFKKVVPYHCIGSVWCHRKKANDASTVSATVNQFNAVSYCVTATILSNVTLRSSSRAKIIIKWIDIAKELRVLKNFSSLKAIISGLQSGPIHRLRKTWLAVAREKVELFEELSRIFSEDNNQLACRELLMKEGTAKMAEIYGINDRHLKKTVLAHKRSHSDLGLMQGTVPYLGTFLTDLTMIDTALPDNIECGWINFEKRRKEFEVIAQIKLLQSAANYYNITADQRFRCWFYSVDTFNENESYELSCQIEPMCVASMRNNKKIRKGFTLFSSLGRRMSIGSLHTPSSGSRLSVEYSSNSMPSSPSSCHSNISMSRQMSTTSLISLSDVQSSCISKDVEFYIIRVSLDTHDKDKNGFNLYRSIMLSNREHTPAVISTSLMKHGIMGKPEDYTLSQILPEGELELPNHANVFYAINTAHDLNFVLRKKTDIQSPVIKQSKKGKIQYSIKRLLSM